MGRLDEAREIIERLRAITPIVMPRVMPFPEPEHRELFLSGLRLAAGEADMSQTRRLAAILAADVAGYSRLMGADEEGASTLIDRTLAAANCRAEARRSGRTRSRYRRRRVLRVR